MKTSPILDIDVDTKSCEKAMRLIAKDALPVAAAATLNQTADMITSQQLKNVKRDFTVRTPYTLKSMESGRARPYKALNKAKGKNVDRMFSRVGSYSKYLWMQEDGGDFKAESGGAVPIATEQARTSKSDKKPIAKRHRLPPGELKDGPYGNDGNQFIGTPKGGGRPRGLYLRDRNNKRLTMLRNLMSEIIHIKPTHFHKAAVKAKGSDQQIAHRFVKNAEKEIQKAVIRGK